MKYKIYYIADKEKCLVRYIGITKQNLKIRIYQHLKIKNKNTYKDNWLKKINYNIKYGILFQTNDFDRAREVELYLIRKYKSKLVNLQDRGLCKDTIWKKEKSILISNTLKRKYANKEITINCAKIVYVWDSFGNYINEYVTGKECAKQLNIPYSKIGAVCNNTCRYYTNYTFSHINLFPVNKYFKIFDILENKSYYFLSKVQIKEFLNLKFDNYKVNKGLYKKRYLITFNENTPVLGVNTL